MKNIYLISFILLFSGCIKIDQGFTCGLAKNFTSFGTSYSYSTPFQNEIQQPNLYVAYFQSYQDQIAISFLHAPTTSKVYTVSASYPTTDNQCFIEISDFSSGQFNSGSGNVKVRMNGNFWECSFCNLPFKGNQVTETLNGSGYLSTN